MGVSHPTARRKLAELEQEMGLTLFDRRTDGLHPTDQALALLDSAEQVEASMNSLARAAQASDPEIKGIVRVTLPDMLATDLFLHAFTEFNQRWPKIHLQVDASYSMAQLQRREADVALRMMPVGKQPDDTLVGRKAVTLYSAIYGEPTCWIGWRGEEEDRKWILQTPYPNLPIRNAINNGMLQRSACLAGQGLSLLPCFFAEPLLNRLTEPEPSFDLWVLIHPDLRQSPRLKLFREFVLTTLEKNMGRLQGKNT